MSANINVLKTYTSIIHEAKLKSFTIDEMCFNGPFPILALSNQDEKGDKPQVMISAGIHGDEPAGPITIAKLFAEGFFTDDIHWTIFPMMNPSGLIMGTRENDAGIDLNRDYNNPKTAEIKSQTVWLKTHKINFDLSIKLHEDWETTGFYLYALENNGSLASKILDDVAMVMEIEKSHEIDGHEVKDGIIRPEHNAADEMELWPEAIYMSQEYSPPFNYTFETPSSDDLDRRVKAHSQAIKAAVKHFLAQRKTPA